jgi:putative ABC transport system permease protein
VEPNYLEIGHLRVTEGRFFDGSENAAAAPVCVLGAAAKESLFGAGAAIGEYIKLNEQWCHVIGIAAPQLAPQTEVSGVRTEDMNNHGAGDFNVIVPAELLAQQKRTEQLFNTVMVAIASISLLVGGIGIMNIMLAAILERTREIGVRRAVGARRGDIIRQFVIEAVLISFAGGLLGVVFGFGMSRLIAWLAGWSTIVTISSILLAFLVSISVGLIFGIYPAVKAARLDPVEAIRYE